MRASCRVKNRTAITVVAFAFIAGLTLRLIFAMPGDGGRELGGHATPNSPDSGEPSPTDFQPVLPTASIAEVLGSATKGTRIVQLTRFLSTADAAAIAELVSAAENPFVI